MGVSILKFMATKPTPAQRAKFSVQTLNEALTEHSRVPFYALDNSMVTELCSIIGVLYRELQSKGYTVAEIDRLVLSSHGFTTTKEG